MLEYEGKKINLESGFDYLDKSVGKRYIDFAIGIIFSGGCLLLLLLGYLGIISYNYFYGLFVFNFLINYMYSYIYKYEFYAYFMYVYRIYKPKSIFKLVYVSFCFDLSSNT